MSEIVKHNERNEQYHLTLVTAGPVPSVASELEN